jgi:hypothetical protein
MVAMHRITWPLTGLLLGAAAGCAWGWFGAGGYEAIDSAVGTGLLGALAGLLVGAVAAHRGQKR